MYQTKELLLHEDVVLQVTVKDYYAITEVFLLLRTIGPDKEKITRFRLNEPYERFINQVLDCKKSGVVVRK